MSAGKKRAKPGKKTGKNSGTFAKGPDSRRGRGPAPGTGGRPPDEFKARMRELATLPEVERELERVLKSQLSRDWLGALKFVSEHGYGKPNQPVELGVSDSLAALIAGTPKK
jgi:hypothetical protein